MACQKQTNNASNPPKSVALLNPLPSVPVVGLTRHPNKLLHSQYHEANCKIGHTGTGLENSQVMEGSDIWQIIYKSLDSDLGYCFIGLLGYDFTGFLQCYCFKVLLGYDFNGLELLGVQFTGYYGYK
ncbi:hypothetical protein C8J56DRAFT_892777 [Mycena floridula]|nr:hypothetical protein C8J56DRAFT_892777 [Mycena floridula]